MGKALTTERVTAPVTDLGRIRPSGALQGRDGERLTQWLREQVLLHTDEKPIVIYLRHVTPGRKLGDKLGTIQLKALANDQRDEESIPEMAHSIWSKAENYAAGLGGSQQQFAVHSYYESSPGESESSCYFWIKVSTQADQSIDSVPANEAGVLRLVMGKLDRLEDSFCDLMEGSATMMRCMREQLNDMHSQSMEDRKERRENEEAVRKAKMDALDREQVREQAKAQRESQKDLIDTVKTVGLAVARKWGGLDVRDVTSPGSKQLMLTFQSLARDENRFMQVLSSLNEVERANFMEWWEAQIAAVEEMQQKSAKAAAGTPATPAAAPAAPATPEPPKQTLAEQLAIIEAQQAELAAVAAAIKAAQATETPAEPEAKTVETPAVEPETKG
jgi:hypothetical protein